MQTRLRREIQDAKRDVLARGQTELSLADMEAMPYLQAVLKESLRLHTIFPHNYRKAARDDVLPLATPLKTKSGKTVTEIPVSKGTRVILSIAGYNRQV
jgi:cytochrome P450